MPGLRPIDEIERRRAAQEVTDDLKRHNTDMWLSTERAKWEQKTHDKIVEWQPMAVQSSRAALCRPTGCCVAGALRTSFFVVALQFVGLPFAFFGR